MSRPITPGTLQWPAPDQITVRGVSKQAREALVHRVRTAIESGSKKIKWIDNGTVLQSLNTYTRFKLMGALIDVVEDFEGTVVEITCADAGRGVVIVDRGEEVRIDLATACLMEKRTIEGTQKTYDNWGTW